MTSVVNGRFGVWLCIALAKEMAVSGIENWDIWRYGVFEVYLETLAKTIVCLQSHQRTCSFAEDCASKGDYLDDATEKDCQEASIGEQRLQGRSQQSTTVSKQEVVWCVLLICWTAVDCIVCQGLCNTTYEEANSECDKERERATNVRQVGHWVKFS